MAVRISGACLGVALDFEVAPELVEPFRELLPPGWSDGPVDGDARSWTVAHPHDLGAVLSDAELHIAEHVPGLIAIHAGVVAFDGRAIVLPGRSLTGKSTLTAALTEHGGTYYSDEFALLDADGTVLPYPRLIALRARADTAAQLVRPAVVGTQPAEVGLVAALRFQPGTALAMEPVSGGAGTLALIDNAVAAQSRPAEVLSHCAAAARTAHFVEGVRGEADEAARHLVDLLGAL